MRVCDCVLLKLCHTHTHTHTTHTLVTNKYKKLKLNGQNEKINNSDNEYFLSNIEKRQFFLLPYPLLPNSNMFGCPNIRNSACFFH